MITRDFSLECLTNRFAAGSPARVPRRSRPCSVGITPNHLTVAAALLGVSAAVLIASNRPYVGLTVWLAGRLLDAYDDDMLARRSYASPAFGGYRDITPDMLAYSAMAIAFAIANPADQFPWLSILAGDVMASFLLAPSGCCESGSAMIAVSVFPRSRRAWRILAP